jgi:hypothetical protein
VGRTTLVYGQCYSSACGGVHVMVVIVMVVLALVVREVKGQCMSGVIRAANTTTATLCPCARMCVCLHAVGSAFLLSALYYDLYN